MIFVEVIGFNKATEERLFGKPVKFFLKFSAGKRVLLVRIQPITDFQIIQNC